ncbi:hypothetical protein ACTXT7_015609 [Hymenolepis weldensis]
MVPWLFILPDCSVFFFSQAGVDKATTAHLIELNSLKFPQSDISNDGFDLIILFQQTDPGRRFTFISNWPHLTTRGWYRCQLCNVYECRREEFERHLRSEAHKLKRRTSKDCGRDDASAYFCDGENEQHSLGTDIK